MAKTKANSSKRAVSPPVPNPQDLAALEAHFLASFGQEALPPTPHNRALEAQKAEIRKGKRKQEPQDEDISSSAQSQALKRKAKRQPETIVFGEVGGRGRATDDEAALDAKQRWKEFMNTKTAGSGPDAFSSASQNIRERAEAKKAKRKTQEKAKAEGSDDGSEDEAAQITNDRQLSHLLNTTLFSQSSSSRKKGGDGEGKPDLSSHDTLARILELSSSSKERKGQAFGRGQGEKSLKAAQLSKMPANIREGIRSAAGERAEKEVERNRDMGLLNSAYSRKMMGRQVADATMTGKKEKSRDRVRGLGMGVGKFQGGTLKLSKEEVSRIAGEGRDRGSRGGRGGRGGSRGGRGGSRGGKLPRIG